ncbi:MAG: discoidin domain-containing protein [Bacteroidota bacterium]
MKKLVYLFFLNSFLINFTIAQQCTQPDASIWKDTWASCAKSTNPNSAYGNSHWIQYNFGSVRHLSKTWVWNTNDPQKLNQGFKQVKIDYSEDGQNWTHLGEMTFPKAKGEAIYGGFTGPDLSNIKAQYVLLTALSNHGHATCAGLAEIKFNLLPESGTAAPPVDDNEEEEDDNEEQNDDDQAEELCTFITEINLDEFTEVEVEPTAAFLYLAIEEAFEELPFVFEYRTGNDEWEMAEIEDLEIVLENLTPGTTYEYRVTLACGDTNNSTQISTFQTTVCGSISELTVEEVEETEAFIIWQASENTEYYMIEFGLAQGEKERLEVEEAEIYLDELEPDTDYEIRVGIMCGDEIIWGNFLSFTTNEESNLSTSTTFRKLSAKQVHVFPNPTTGQLTVRIKTSERDILSYSISDAQGRVLFRNTIQLYSGSNDLALDLSTLVDGTYRINGVTINQRARVSEQIIKVSR